MKIQAYKVIDDKSPWVLVTVLVPDPTVLCELDGVRVVASFARYESESVRGIGSIPRLDRLEPELFVERADGTNSLGQLQWRYVSPTGAEDAKAIYTLARMLYRETVQPHFIVVDDKP